MRLNFETLAYILGIEKASSLKGRYKLRGVLPILLLCGKSLPGNGANIEEYWATGLEKDIWEPRDSTTCSWLWSWDFSFT